MSSKIDLSVIIPVTERHDDIEELYHEYKSAVEKTGRVFEFLFVLDGPFPDAENQLNALQEKGEVFKVIKLAKWFGEATALKVGFENTSGELIMTLPAYQQVDSSELPRLVSLIESQDMIVARRWPRKDPVFNQLQSRVFNFLMRVQTGVELHDLGCSVRVLRRKVINEVQLYGDLHRFLPVLADRYGFKVHEEKTAQSNKDVFRRIYSSGLYVRRLLDILSVMFLIKFTKKPLRFFGLLGMGTIFLGGILTAYLVMERLIFDIGLADRPALMISSLFVVLGAQILAIGLIGEIVIFTHSKDLKEYTIEEIVN